MQQRPDQEPPLSVILRVFLPFAFGYFLSYIYRVVNAVIAPDLVAEMGLEASDLGLLTSTYFLSFAAFQIPLGMLLDRFGPRRTESALLIVAAAGAFVFALAPNVSSLILGRALIGFGVSACLMAAFKAFVLWFPAEKLPLINGCQMAVGGLGAMSATVPVNLALGITDWRGVFMGLGGLTVLAALIVFLIVPGRENETPKSTLGEQFGGVAAVMTSPVFWRVAPLTFTTQAAFLAAQSLWAGPWLRDVAGLPRDAVARHLMFMAIAMALGFVLAGGVAERLSRFGIRPTMVALFGMTASMILQGLIIVEVPVPPIVIWCLFALLGTTGILVYAGLSQVYPKHLAGRVNTGINLMVFVASFGFQWGVGVIIDLWPATATGGYDAAGYQVGFGAVLGVQVLAALWLILYRKAPLPLRFDK